MSTQRQLRVSFSKADAKEALKRAIPSMDGGFNIDAVYGFFSLHEEDAREVMEVVTRIAMRRAGVSPDKAPFPWSDCKVAFDVGDGDALWRWLDANNNGVGRLPKGWSLAETDSSGARSVAIFRVEGSLREADGRVVADLIREVMAEAAPREAFVRCDRSVLGMLAAREGEMIGDYDDTRGGVTMMLTAQDRQTLAQYPADFEIVITTTESALSKLDGAARMHAYSAMERDSLSGNPELVGKADEAMARFFDGTIDTATLSHYIERDVEFVSLNPTASDSAPSP